MPPSYLSTRLLVKLNGTTRAVVADIAFITVGIISSVILLLLATYKPYCLHHVAVSNIDFSAIKNYCAYNKRSLLFLATTLKRSNSNLSLNL